MMTDNNFWQFQPTMVDAPMMLAQQQQSQAQPINHTQQQQQQQWTEDDKRRWSHNFGDFDMDANTNKLFSMDDYSNHEPSEGDSPDSGNGSSSKRHDLLSDSSLFQGGDQKQRRKEQNRAAQRAFRERKERFVKELQTKIKEMEKQHESELSRVKKENESLKSLVKKMEAEIYTLKGAAMAFDVSLHKLREAGLDIHHHHHQPQHQSMVRDQPSPPRSDRHSPMRYDNSVVDRLQVKDTASTSSSIFDSNSNSNAYNDHHSMSTDEDNHSRKDEGEEEVASFAERETNRFDHKIDPIMNSGIKLIPCSQIWERLSQHPNFEDFDMDKLCEELKKKAKCSGTGPVIPESELLDVLRRMDVGIA